MPLSESAREALLFIGLFLGIPLLVIVYFCGQIVLIWWLMSLFSKSVTSPFAWSVWSQAMPWNILRRRRERARQKREERALAEDPREIEIARRAHARIQARDRPYDPAAQPTTWLDIRKPAPAVLAADRTTPSNFVTTNRYSPLTPEGALNAEQLLEVLEAWWVIESSREDRSMRQTQV